ncbi:MAG: hypothetical protein RL375_1775 [Pseudomonadota bacterium]
MPDTVTEPGRPKKRVIALGGGGPVAGFHIGALEALEDVGVNFDIWSLSCIGAWVGVVYHQLPAPNRASRTYEFFKEHAFRDTASYRGFPVNKAFAPNLTAFSQAWLRHCQNPQTWQDVFSFGHDLPAAAQAWATFLQTPARWLSEGDRHAHVLNNVLAVNPLSRFMTSLAFMSEVNGLSNIHYDDSTFLQGLDVASLDLIAGRDLDDLSRQQLALLARDYTPQQVTPTQAAVPEIYHNAWRCATGGEPGRLELFNNKWLRYWNRKPGEGRRDYLPITRPSLCACSALPYIEQTVKIPNDDGRDYSEGALVDTVNFQNLVEDHPDLDEIWVCRIVDYRQVRKPDNLHDSLGNLCQQFAAEVGENDIKLFKTHLRKSAGRTPRVVEIPLPQKSDLRYRWDHETLDLGREEGRRAVVRLLQAHPDLAQRTTRAPAWA